MLSDLDIAQAARLRPIRAVAADLGLTDDDIELYGRHIAKIDLAVLQRLTDQPRGRYIVVTAITPTPLLKGGGFAGRWSTVSVPPNARADPSVS
jgi:formate--tetrahydrofolate ligase